MGRTSSTTGKTAKSYRNMPEYSEFSPVQRSGCTQFGSNTRRLARSRQGQSATFQRKTRDAAQKAKNPFHSAKQVNNRLISSSTAPGSLRVWAISARSI
jgi:hypothetical protein